jgi:hypothetical protein
MTGRRHLSQSVDPDSLTIVATHLRPEEAGMLRGLLESAGITAVVQDENLSSVNPFLQPVIGGVKVAVRKADEDVARRIIKSAGAVPGFEPDDQVDIPEDEWSRPQEGSEPGLAQAPWYRAPVVRLGVFAALVLVGLRCLKIL